MDALNALKSQKEISNDRRTSHFRSSGVVCTRRFSVGWEKIRALAKAGYDRTGIGRHLGIKYQHVRKVLLDAGITSGLRRQVEAEREPVVVEVALAPREAASWEVLLRAGFRFVGGWIQDSKSLIKLDARVPSGTRNLCVRS